MRLREALDLCADAHEREWVSLPGERPATAMVVGLLDVGETAPTAAILAGHSIAVYEPDARLSLVWPVPDQDERDARPALMPQWAQRDDEEWDHALEGWVVVLLGGAPIWQERIWYLDWGTGIGGYVPAFRPLASAQTGWTASTWAVGLARLLNVVSGSEDFDPFDPTRRLVPEPLPLHPLDARRSGG